VIISLTPVTAPDAVTIRRMVLWAALGTVVAIATHELRDRSHRSRLAADRLQARLTQLTILQDRDRIAGALQDNVIQQVFAAGLSLQSTAMAATQPEVRGRILATADDLDLVIRLIRDTIFGLEQRLRGHGLRAELAGLAGQLSPVPEIIFTGPVDGTLDPVRAALLVQTLKQALETITAHSTPSRIAVATSDTAYVAEIETVWPGSAEAAAWVDRVENGGTPAGISLTIEAASGRTRFIWSLPLAEQP
jgi:two-component system, NarL family, sensor histidine kinase DevS